jgi:hypothetical protein
MKKLAAILLPAVLLTVGACKKTEAPPPTPAPTIAQAPPTTLPAPVGVKSVTLGNAIGPDKRVTTSSDLFTPRETIYASVESDGNGPAKVRALWTFVKGDKTAKVDETVIEFPSSGPNVSEFHVTKPSGWPKGDYKIEIFLNDAPTPAMVKTFKVA